MSMGGGTFTSFTKVIPGVYTNVKGSSVIKEIPVRGYVAVAVGLKWGPAGFITVDADTIEKDCMKVFGYPYTDNEMVWLRELISGGAKIIYVYNSNSSGVKASGTYCTAKYAGSRGNSLKVTVVAQTDSSYDVSIHLGTELVDTQNVDSYSELVGNDYVDFNIENATLAATAQTALSSGTDGSAAATAHETFLDLCESKYINVIVCNSTDSTTIALYKEYSEHFVEETALKTQVLLYQNDADFYGTLNVYHPAKSGGLLGASGFIFWFAGAISSLLPSESLTNKEYSGELETDMVYTQAQIITNIETGRLVFNEIEGKKFVAKEVNSLTTFTDKSKNYAINQHIRIINDILTEQSKVLNTKHIGSTLPNDNGIGSVYSDLYDVLKDGSDNSYLKLPVSTDLEVSIVNVDDKESLKVKQKFETIVCVDKIYIDTIAD